MIDYIISLYYTAQYWLERWLKKPSRIEKIEYSYFNSNAWAEHNALVEKVNEIIDRING